MSTSNKFNNKYSWIFLAAIASALLIFGGLRDSGPRSQQDRIDAITMRLACPTCQGESVYVSRASAAEAIRAEVARQVGSGLRTDDETIAYIEQRFGGQVLLLPRSSGIDSLVWALPIAALICGVAALGVVFRKWRTADDGAVSAEDSALVDAAMAFKKCDGFGRMINPDEQASLEEERRFLLESLRDLEREHAAGDIDDEDYRVLKNGYVHRAAQIIKVLDAGVDARVTRPRASMKRRIGSVAVVVLIAGAAGWFVAQQSGQRLPGQTISGGIEDSTASMLSQARSLNFSDPKTAIDLYSKVLALNPDHVEALTYRSWLIALVARDAPDDMKILAFAAATQGLDHAIDVEPEYPDAHCFLGIVRFRLAGDAAGAKEQLDICAALNPPAEVKGFVDSIRAEVATALNQ